jgi:hypothetical protein
MQEEGEKAAQEYFSELFDPDLAMARAQTMEDLRKARRIAHAFRFICPSYYIPGEQDWGRFACNEVQTSLQTFQHAPAPPSLVSMSASEPSRARVLAD